jgi:arylsulfate sulfotransferase
MERKKEIILIIILLFLLAGILVFVYFNEYDRNDKLVKESESLISLQEGYEDDLDANGYTIDNPKVVIDPYKASPLTAMVMFETKESTEVKVSIQGKDDKTGLSYTFPKGKEHYLAIYGLYAGYDNVVTIEYGDVKKDIIIETDSLPDDFVLPSSVNGIREELDNDFYFFTPSAKGYSAAYDINGDVRWYLTNYALWDNTRLKNGRMLVSTERLMYSPYYMTGLYEIDMFGKIYKEYSLAGGYHHDYYELPNGNLLVASDDFGNEDGTVEDVIVEVDKTTGAVVKTFDLKKILNMEDGKSENWTSYDWFHNNSVWYDEKTNSITLSGRHQDAVINIDYNSGKLNWIIGDKTGWSSEYQKYFFTPVGSNFEWQWSQHAAMITPEGYVFIFDNGNNKSKDKASYVEADNSYSRGVMYKIDTKNMTIEQIYEYGKERGSSFYSPYISDVDYLDKGHYIIHSGGIVNANGKASNQPAGLSTGDVVLKSDTVEVKDDRVIFEMVLPTNNYRVEKMNIYGGFVWDDSKAVRVGSLGKTTVSDKKLKRIEGVKPDSEYKKHNISFTKEVDRLAFSGKFKKDENVKVILYNNFVSNYYNIRISKKPYTALCLDVFTEEETENGISITRYVNGDGLKGSYSIYLEIDGKVYNTGEYVKF